jgi:hypothetical protein
MLESRPIPKVSIESLIVVRSLSSSRSGGKP